MKSLHSSSSANDQEQRLDQCFSAEIEAVFQTRHAMSEQPKVIARHTGSWGHRPVVERGIHCAVSDLSLEKGWLLRSINVMSKQAVESRGPAEGSSSPLPNHTTVGAAPAASSMLSVGSYVFVGALIAAAFGAGWYMAQAGTQHAAKDVLPAEGVIQHQRGSVVVTVEPVVHRAVQRTVEALGTLHGFEEVTIAARVEGRVRRIVHDVSDRVNPTELLLEIDPTDYELSVRQADRALQVELAKLGLKTLPEPTFDLEKVPYVAKAKSVMDHAKSRLERINRLAATKTVSPEDAETAASDYRTSHAEYDNQLVQAESGVATIQMKQVGLEVAREQLANTKVLVPTPAVPLPDDGPPSYVVSERSVSEGTLVRPGTEIFRIVINQTLKLRVPVPERHTSEVKPGQQVQVFVAHAETPVAGTVTRCYPTIDTTTRTFQVEIQVPNPQGDLKPGSFAKAAILTRLDPAAATIPLSALIQFAGITKVFVVNNGQAKEVPVILGTQTTEWVEVVQPELIPGTQVITSGLNALADQTTITIRTPDSSPPTTKESAKESAPKKPQDESNKTASPSLEGGRE